MPRLIFTVIVGVTIWFVVATIGNFALRAMFQDYSAAEASMNFTFMMMIGRLALGLLSSFITGLACTVISRGLWASRVTAILMLVLFLPVHYMLWDKFPIWYHLFFLITLVPAIMAGAGVPRIGRTAKA